MRGGGLAEALESVRTAGGAAHTSRDVTRETEAAPTGRMGTTEEGGRTVLYPAPRRSPFTTGIGPPIGGAASPPERETA